MHKANKPRRWMLGRKRRIAILTTVLASAVTLALALSLFAPITGQVDVIDPEVEWTGTPTAPTGPTDYLLNGTGNGAPAAVGARCTPTLDGDGANLNILVDEVFGEPGGYCIVLATVLHGGGGEEPKVQTIDFTDLTDEAFVRLVISGVSTANACGERITESGIPVAFKITVPAGTPAGSTTAIPAASLTAVDDTDTPYVSADCPRA